MATAAMGLVVAARVGAARVAAAMAVAVAVRAGVGMAAAARAFEVAARAAAREERSGLPSCCT